MSAPSQPPKDCRLCPRLAAFRDQNCANEPDWHNAPVPSFGSGDAKVLIVGLAPGRGGANRTGRPFTGDFAGDLLYGTLLKYGLAQGRYDRRRDDGLSLVDLRVTNAVRCVPPQNKPLPAEIAACNGFLRAELGGLKKLRAILVLGTIAHVAVLKALGEKPSRFAFAHGAEHRLSGGSMLLDSYHCSRLNTNTGRLTTEMFEAVIRRLKEAIDLES